MTGGDEDDVGRSGARPPSASRPRRPLAERLLPGLGRRREERRLAAALGDGVWRRAHDRVHRSVDRYHQVLEGVVADAAPGASDVVLPALKRTGTDLVGVLDRTAALCVAAQRAAPSAGLDVPRVPTSAGLPDELHRRLSRTGTSVATAAEAATMARVSLRGGEPAVATERADAAARAAALARGHLRGPDDG